MAPSFVAPLNFLDAQMPAFDPMAIPRSEPQQFTSRSPSSSGSSNTNTSVDSTQVGAVHDELSHLTAFAESMEKKFDAVVRQRIRYRDVYTEFGIPMDAIETPTASSAALSDETSMEALQRDRAAAGHVPSLDLSEISFYHSLAELKRRLKWLREDVGSLVPPCIC
ncbi:Hypothetical predicted protein [Lecanosticta acicola]|uniref:Uncharacterized protein n=1 Tax=Lecanosticta acicola TaxID=111012 RepID=A0AAI8Z941_9PEZI|nr:Hypothetical predicted protein [Lecanosticta acicola]